MEFRYKRRQTHAAQVGELQIGGDNHIVVQSMINVDTNDIESGLAQSKRLVDVGCELIRFTAQGKREANALKEVREQLNREGIKTPLSADIHFNPAAAYEAAKFVEKVRINPGNFYDKGKRFEHIDYSDVAYNEEVGRLQEAFRQFVLHCRAHHTAIRIGVNHGSLSDRIMSRYGDTPKGMVESCMEYLQVCHELDFRDVVISIKASNPLVMVETVLLLVEELDRVGEPYPLHLGVTEAGSGEDGRLKSAVGIGALLAKGIGDTIRVSLSEEPEAEIPIAKHLVELTEALETAPAIQVEEPVAPYREKSIPLVVLKADKQLRQLLPDERPDILIVEDEEEAREFSDFRTIERGQIRFIKDSEALELKEPIALQDGELLSVRLTHPNVPAMLEALDRRMRQPFLISLEVTVAPHLAPVEVGFQLGAALMRGQGRGLLLESETMAPQELSHMALGLLQATRRRISRTEFISCPGCGRTLFDLQETVAKVQAATKHLKGLKIGVMGCIVNGPGEMADADYGYVGSTPGRIDLYKEKELMVKRIPAEEAVDRLVDLIKEHGDWQEPPQ